MNGLNNKLQFKLDQFAPSGELSPTPEERQHFIELYGVDLCSPSLTERERGLLVDHMRRGSSQAMMGFIHQLQQES